jgi:hypothetical protein
MANDMQSELVVTGPDVGSGMVPAEVVVRLLSGMQQLALIFAASAEGRPVSQRFKPTAELRQRYNLRCGVPSAGSYHLPIDLVDVSPQRQLIKPSQVLDGMQNFIRAVQNDDKEAAKHILPESRYRERALRELRSFAPRPAEGWSASVGLKGSPAVSLNGRLGRNIDEWLKADLTEQAVMTVTGELIRINFDEHKLFIRHPVTGRQIECTYIPEIEDDLIESRRGFIQVTGEFVLDADGEPLRLTSVTRIEAVDCSPLVFARIEHNGLVLKAKDPLELIPMLDEESQQLLLVTYEPLDLHAFASTRDDLAGEVAEHLAFAWKAYVKEDPSRLTPRAEELANALRERFEEVSDATK